MTAARTLIFPLAATLAIVAIIATGAAHAQQVDESLPPLADLTITSEYRTVTRSVNWNVTVKNNTVGAHPGVYVHLVEVDITISDPVRGTSTQMWTIRNLPPGDSETRIFGPLRNARGVTTGPALVAQRFYAKITKSDPVESPRFEFNNATEHWAMENRRNAKTSFTNGDIGLDVGSISDRSPGSGGATTFTVSARNPGDRIPGVNSADQSDSLLDVQVEISLSPGLSFAGTQPEEPSGTTFDTTTGIWNVGTLFDNPLMLQVAVNLTSESLADLSLEERCLTAKVISAVPWFASDPLKRANDTATACLGRSVVLTQGEVGLFYVLDCVGATSTPCTSADTLELVVELRDNVYLQAEAVIVQIQPPLGRQSDGTWHTGRPDGEQPGVVHSLDITDLAVPGTWTHMKREISVPGGFTLPGSFSIRPTAALSFNFLDPVNARQAGPFALDSAFNVKQIVKFGKLGTYKVTPAFSFTHKTIDVNMDNNKDVFTASATYVFHVGPMADLEVRDAGAANPEVPTGQSAYTVVAVNNGPDTASAVRVELAGVPEGAEAVPSYGEYVQGTCQSSLCDGVWTIGELIPGYNYRPSVYAAEGAALTLIAASGASITAEIENMENYCVRIKDDDPDPENDLECTGSVPTGYTDHSIAYYDHIEGNNTTTVELRAGGLQGRHPGAPGGVKVTETPVANILTWQPVESVYGHPVTRYEVQRATSTWATLASDVDGAVYLDMDPGSGDPDYRVRAVNEFGVPGPWSESSGRTPGVPQDFTAAVAGSARIDLSWGAPDAVIGVSVSGYEIEVSSDGGDTWTQLAAEHSESPYAHNDGTLAPGATRDYRVRTVGMVGGKKLKSGWATASAEVPYPTPGVPKSFAASGSSDTRAALSWGAPDTVAGVSVTGYELDFSTDGGNSWSSLPDQAAAATSTSHTDPDLSADAVRQYRLRTVGSVGGVTVKSGYTYAVATRDYPTPGAPRDFTALAVNRSQVNLSWSEPEAVAGVRLTGYHLEFSTDGNTWNRLPAAMSTLSTTTTRHEHVDAALSAGAIRQYRVRAVGADSNNAVFESGWVFASAATEEVGAPRNLTAARDGIGRIDLTWDEPAFGTSTITGYRIDYTPVSPEQWQTLEHSHGSRRYEHTGLSPGQEYCYRVAAVYAGGTGPFSARACATTEGAPANLPGKPENLRIAQVGSNYVTLEWDAPSAGGAVEYYEWRSNVHGPAEVSAASVTVRGLAPGSSYDFQVRAGNGYGPGGWSRHILVTLNRASSVVVVKASPAELEVEKRGSGSFNVRLNRSPQWPLALYTHSIGPECLTDQLAYQQGKIMLPDNLRPSKEFWEDGWWGPPDDRWAQSWRKGVDIRIDASGCRGGETTVVEYSLYTVPFSYLEGQPMWEELDLNEDEWREKWGVDPLDGISGPSVKVTVVDGD